MIYYSPTPRLPPLHKPKSYIGGPGNEALDSNIVECYLQGLVGRVQVYTGTLEDYLGQSNLPSINKVYTNNS